VVGKPGFKTATRRPENSPSNWTKIGELPKRTDPGCLPLLRGLRSGLSGGWRARFGPVRRRRPEVIRRGPPARCAGSLPMLLGGGPSAAKPPGGGATTEFCPIIKKGNSLLPPRATPSRSSRNARPLLWRRRRPRPLSRWSIGRAPRLTLRPPSAFDDLDHADCGHNSGQRPYQRARGCGTSASSRHRPSCQPTLQRRGFG
jgi:hypothetical protein